ncbi:MAG TPA: hypothetical protein VJR25_09320 [Microbacterium sp.]|uniref:hypothetical protein n=1 Tax=Microbacterium sp. TaxID=51671 RepID=UPI002B464FA6|nr:hypothetical protein [Microbacterium sp.]HKT56960.1 hypothetical protein [Microbacterium sp.]
MNHLLIRSESISSSWIEGYIAGLTTFRPPRPDEWITGFAQAAGLAAANAARLAEDVAALDAKTLDDLGEGGRSQHGLVVVDDLPCCVRGQAE